MVNFHINIDNIIFPFKMTKNDIVLKVIQCNLQQEIYSPRQVNISM